jgi:hypothetical protein
MNAYGESVYFKGEYTSLLSLLNLNELNQQTCP